MRGKYCWYASVLPGTWSFRGSKNSNRVSVDESAEGSLTEVPEVLLCVQRCPSSYVTRARAQQSETIRTQREITLYYKRMYIFLALSVGLHHSFGSRCSPRQEFCYSYSYLALMVFLISNLAFGLKLSCYKRNFLLLTTCILSRFASIARKFSISANWLVTER